MKAIMGWKSKSWGGFLGILPCALVLLGAALPASSQVVLPEGKGKETLQTACTVCHGLKEIVTQKMSHDEWKDKVNEMITNGAEVPPDAIDPLVDYLAKSFPKEGAKSETPAKVNVNKATAKELVTALALSDKEAAAVVAYREKNGNFTKWEDLQKVQDLDTKKIEDKKDLMKFEDKKAESGS